MAGGLNNFMVPATDISAGIIWGGSGIATGATGTVDGATNTSTIVNCLTNGTGNPGCTGSNIDPITYAAGLCSTYEAAGGFTTGWFLPARTQLGFIYTNKGDLNGFLQMAIGVLQKVIQRALGLRAFLMGMNFIF